MDEVWQRAARPRSGYRQIFDARLALTLIRHGVSEFVTRNTGHFQGYGFKSLVNPIGPL